MQTFKTETRSTFNEVVKFMVREGLTFDATEYNGIYTITFTGGF